LDRFKNNSIRGRWYFYNATVLFATIMIVVSGFTYSMYRYYISAIGSEVTSRARSAAGFFAASAERLDRDVRDMALEFAESWIYDGKTVLQIITPDGTIDPDATVKGDPIDLITPDVAAALSSGETILWRGFDASDLSTIISVTVPLLHPSGCYDGAIRLISDTRFINREMISLFMTSLIVGLLIAAAILMINAYFLVTLTDPINELINTARQISDGNPGIQAEKKYNDEIGLLTDTINDMSAKLGLAEKLQTEFISSVSHELRTPLTAITGWTETLQYDTEIRGDSRRGLEIIGSEAERLKGLVDDLLEFTRILDKRFTLNTAQIDISKFLEEVIFAFGRLAARENVSFQFTPPETKLPMITGDVERLRQVFLNIFDNAAKHGRGGRRVVITISNDDRFVSVTTRDYGPGVREDELPLIKRKFYKGSSKTRGSGIGLAVCDEIITLHKGELKLKNAPGGGLAVTVKLPIADARA